MRTAVLFILFLAWSTVVLAQTVTVTATAEPDLAKKIEVYSQALVAALTALGVSIGGIITAVVALRAKAKALYATVLGAEEGFEKVRQADPELYAEAKAKLKARTQEFSAVKHIVDDEIHGGEEAKPHTQSEIKVPKGLGVIVLVGLLMLVGCATPAEDYIRADEAAWKHYDEDGRLEKWIAEAEAKGEAAKTAGVTPLPPGTLTHEQADALRKLNTGRRARVSHAIASLEKGDSK